MTCMLSRRRLARLSLGAVGAAIVTRSVSARQGVSNMPSLPIRWAGNRAGDGFLVRHACENTWYNPGWWHTGEDWYALDDVETGGAEVVAVTAGTVVFAGSDYPGRVVILQHDDDLYSMYGHLDYALDVSEGEAVVAGDRLGLVLFRSDGRAPSHLHYEMRRFLYAAEINGDTPRYEVGCGFQCAPGPGYWPIDAPEHPSDIGWLNPTHQFASLASGSGLSDQAEAVVSIRGDGREIELRTQPNALEGTTLGALSLVAGARYRLLEIAAGDPASTGTSAEAYDLWFRIETEEAQDSWMSAVASSNRDTGSDGRPSGVDFLMLPSI